MKAQSLDLEVYDGTYFVDFSFAEKEPVRARRRAGRPASSRSRGRASNPPASKPGEAFFNNLTPSSNFGAQFANKIAVKCP